MPDLTRTVPTPAQEAEASQLRRLTTAVSMSQYRLDAAAAAALHARVAEAEAAAAAATQRAAAAEAEAAKGATDRHVRTLELNTLRDALRSMEATSDNKAALGKLHEEVLRLRAREVSARLACSRVCVRVCPLRAVKLCPFRSFHQIH